MSIETPNLWCPNCKRIVKPLVKFPRQGWYIIIAIWILVSGLAVAAGIHSSTAGPFALFVGVVVGRIWGDRHKVRSCPVCLERNLSAVPSSESSA